MDTAEDRISGQDVPVGKKRKERSRSRSAERRRKHSSKRRRGSRSRSRSKGRRDSSKRDSSKRDRKHKDKKRRHKDRSSRKEEDGMMWVEAEPEVPVVPAPHPTASSIPPVSSGVPQEEISEAVTSKEPLSTTAASEGSGPVRDSWMLAVPKRDVTRLSAEHKERLKKMEEEKKRAENVYVPVELNEETRLKTGRAAPKKREGDNGEEPKLMVVGDGGARWRKAAMRNAIEEAKEKGISLTQAVAERLGEDALTSTPHRSQDYYSSASFVKAGNRGGRGSDSRRQERDYGRNRDRRSDRGGDRGGDRRRDYRRRGDGDDRGGRRQDDRRQDRYRPYDDRQGRSSGERPRQSLADLPLPERYRNMDPVAPTPLTDSQQRDTAGSGDSSERREKRTSPSRDARNVPTNGPSGVPSVAPLAQPAIPVNRLRAMAIKAKMKGNMEEYERLQGLMEEAKKGGAPPAAAVEVVSGLDAYGRKIALPSGSGAVAAPTTSKKRLKEQFNDHNERVKYFHDDDKKSLRDLVEEEKMGERDPDSVYAKNIMKNSRYRDANIREDEDFDHELYQSKTSRLSRQEQEERLRQEQIKQHLLHERATKSCNKCLETNNRKGLMISLGDKTYLTLPSRGQLVQGHCLIVPNEHIASVRMADEGAQLEVAQFKKYLQRMFADAGKEPIFIETAMRLKKQRHTFVECIPLPRELAEEAPLFFRKEILESEKKWADNPKLISTTKKGLNGRFATPLSL